MCLNEGESKSPCHVGDINVEKGEGVKPWPVMIMISVTCDLEAIKTDDWGLISWLLFYLRSQETSTSETLEVVLL